MSANTDSGLSAQSQITLRIQRGEGNTYRWQTIQVPFERGMTVLDALLWAKANVDGSISMRYSCRMGVCGSCGMFINGFPRLACHTQISELGTSVVTVQPLPNLPRIKDLAVDLAILLAHHKDVKPFLLGPEHDPYGEIPEETLQSEEQLLRYLQFAYCIKCGLCLAACPTVASDREFLGPQALTQLFRFIEDSRDGGFAERIDMADVPHGPWRCHFAGACSQACPKGVDPALGIQLLKRRVVAARLGGSGKPR